MNLIIKIIGVIIDNKKSRRDDIIIAIANSEKENPEGMTLLLIKESASLILFAEIGY